MRKLAIFLFAILIISCKKEKEEFVFKDLWVERTLRLDTIEFNSPLSSSTQSIYFNSNTPYKGSYFYQLKTDSILLRNFASSSGIFRAFYFKASGSSLFTIGNFFQRTSLPATVEFEKIK